MANTPTTEINPRGLLIAVAIASGVLLVGILAFISLHDVGPGERAVVFHSNGSLSELGPGKFQFVMPVLNSVTKYDVRSQLDNAEATAATQDLQDVNVHVAVQFHPDPTQISWLHQNIGGDYLGKVIQPAVQEAVKSSTAKHSAVSIIQELPQVKDEIERVLQTRLAAREGWKKGRPGMQMKPNLEPHEVAYVREQRAMGRRGAGWGRMSAELTRRRGALEVVDAKARERRTVSPSWLRMEWRRIEAGSIVRSWKTKHPAKINGGQVAGVGESEESEAAKIREVAAGGKA